MIKSFLRAVIPFITVAIIIFGSYYYLESQNSSPIRRQNAEGKLAQNTGDQDDVSNNRDSSFQEQFVNIDSCKTIETPGDYKIIKDLVNGKSEPCIKILNTSNVTLDCQNHSITSKNEYHGLFIKKGANFKIKNCTLVSSIKLPSNSAEHVLRIEDSKNGELSNSSIGGNYATISDSSFISFLNNTFNTQFSINKSNHLTLRGNTFNYVDGAVVVALYDGNNNSLISNILDGKSDGVFENKKGTDDVVFLDNEKDDLIQGNALKNAYECAIEFNNVSGVRIVENTAANLGLNFLCGWHYVSVKGLVVKDNKASNSSGLFMFFRERALRSNEEYVYFLDNLFENNVLSDPKNNAPYRGVVYIDFDRSIVPVQNYRIGNNIFKNNDFTKVAGPLMLAPKNIIVDGGGNICSRAEEGGKGGGDELPFNCN
jgi:hypothetical protein